MADGFRECFSVNASILLSTQTVDLHTTKIQLRLQTETRKITKSCLLPTDSAFMCRYLFCRNYVQWNPAWRVMRWLMESERRKNKMCFCSVFSHEIMRNMPLQCHMQWCCIFCICRCEVSLCCKPGSSSDWRSYKPLPGQVQPLHPSYCSLLCLPITSFSGSYPWHFFFLPHWINPQRWYAVKVTQGRLNQSNTGCKSI